jgi:hypothetical protein
MMVGGAGPLYGFGSYSPQSHTEVRGQLGLPDVFIAASQIRCSLSTTLLPSIAGNTSGIRRSQA